MKAVLKNCLKVTAGCKAVLWEFLDYLVIQIGLSLLKDFQRAPNLYPSSGEGPDFDLKAQNGMCCEYLKEYLTSAKRT